MYVELWSIDVLHKYFNSLLTKQQFYQKLFIVNNAKVQDSYYYGNEFKFNEDDFEFELVVSPDTVLLSESKPWLYNQPLSTTATVINSRVKKNQKIEEIELVEEYEIYKGFREENDPTKFSEELSHYSEGLNGKLTRKYLITKVDGVEKNRELIDLEIGPSKPDVMKTGIRGGIMRGGKG